MSIDTLIVQRDLLMKRLGETSAKIIEIQRQINHGVRGEFSLTARQFEVLHLVKQGMKNRQIGLELGITERTVKAHVSALLHKFKKYSRIELKLCA